MMIMTFPLETGEVNRLGEYFLRGAGENAKRFIVLYHLEINLDGTELAFEFKHRTTPKRHRVAQKLAEPIVSAPLSRTDLEFLQGVAFSLGVQAGEWALDEDISHVLSGQKMLPGLSVLHQ